MTRSSALYYYGKDVSQDRQGFNTRVLRAWEQNDKGELAMLAALRK